MFYTNVLILGLCRDHPLLLLPQEEQATQVAEVVAL